jgi:hypothetical protein
MLAHSVKLNVSNSNEIAYNWTHVKHSNGVEFFAFQISGEILERAARHLRHSEVGGGAPQVDGVQATAVDSRHELVEVAVLTNFSSSPTFRKNKSATIKANGRGAQK